jgi:hypothetical protein
MPPPVKIDPRIHRIIEIGSHNKTVLTGHREPEKNTSSPQPQQNDVKQKKLSKGQKARRNRAMRKAAKENVSSKNKIVIINAPLQGQQNDVEQLSKGQRMRRNKAMRKAAEKNIEGGAVTNTQTDSYVKTKKKKTKKKKKKVEKMKENDAEPAVKRQDGTTIASVKTKKKVEMKIENHAETTVKSQDGIANASIKKKKKKTETKTENHADTRRESEPFDDMNFCRLQARYPAFKVLTHTFDYLQGKVFKNEENIIHKHFKAYASLSYIRLCVQFQKQLSEPDGCFVHFTNVLKVVDNFFTNLSVLNTVHKTKFQEPQQKRIFCVCNVIKTVAMHHYDILQLEKKSIQKTRPKDINVSVVVRNILYNLDTMVLRFFTLNGWEYTFVESEDELVSYVIVQSSLILLEYTRKIILDVIRRVESGCVDYPCLGCYRDVFVAYGQPPGMLFASFVKNKRLPQLFSFFGTANKETQTDNQDDNSQKMLDERDDADDRHNFGSCSGSMENIDETSSLSDLENDQTQLSFSIIEDLTENRKFFYDTYNTKFNSKSWRRFRTSYLNEGESSCVGSPEVTLTHEENGNFTEYPLQAVTQVCELKKISITLVMYMILQFLHDFIFTF